MWWRRGVIPRWCYHARLYLLEGFHSIYAIFVVPCQASGEMLFDISYKRVEDTIVCLDVFDM